MPFLVNPSENTARNLGMVDHDPTVNTVTPLFVAVSNRRAYRDELAGYLHDGVGDAPHHIAASHIYDYNPATDTTEWRRLDGHVLVPVWEVVWSVAELSQEITETMIDAINLDFEGLSSPVNVSTPPLPFTPRFVNMAFSDPLSDEFVREVVRVKDSVSRVFDHAAGYTPDLLPFQNPGDVFHTRRSNTLDQALRDLFGTSSTANVVANGYITAPTARRSGRRAPSWLSISGIENEADLHASDTEWDKTICLGHSLRHRELGTPPEIHDRHMIPHIAARATILSRLGVGHLRGVTITVDDVVRRRGLCLSEAYHEAQTEGNAVILEPFGRWMARWGGEAERHLRYEARR